MLKISEKEFEFYAKRYLPSILFIYETEEPEINQIYTKEFRKAKEGFENIKTIVIKLSILENIINSEDKKFTAKHILLIGNKHIMDSALNTDETKIRSFFHEIRTRQICVRRNNFSKVKTNLESGNKNPQIEENSEILLSNSMVKPEIKVRKRSASPNMIKECRDSKRRYRFISRTWPANYFLLPLKHITNSNGNCSSIDSIKFGTDLKCRFFLPSVRKSNRSKDSTSRSHISKKYKNIASEVNLAT